MQTLLPIVALGAFALGCSSLIDSQSCTLVGCESGVRATFGVGNGRADELADTKVVVCRNGVCEEGVITTTVPGQKLLSCRFASTTVGVRRGPECSLASNQGNLTVQFMYGLADGEAKDGDTYAFRILDKKTSEPALKKEGSVTYSVSQPNGPECGPTCTSATLD